MKGKNMKFLLALLMLTSTAYGATDDLKRLQTYHAGIGGFTVGTSPTDLCSIAGSTSKVIRVLRAEISSIQGTAGVNNFFFIKRSTANVGGAPVLMTKVPSDSLHNAAAASTVYYLSNPVSGTSTGTIRTRYLLTGAAAGTTGPSMGLWDFLSDGAGVPIVLRGVSDNLSISLDGVVLPAGLKLDCNFIWTESDR